MRGSAPRIRPPALEGQQRDLKAAGRREDLEREGHPARHSGRRSPSASLSCARATCSPVTKPDRLARSTAELLAIEADLTKRGIGLVVLSMGGEKLDTRNPPASSC